MFAKIKEILDQKKVYRLINNKEFTYYGVYTLVFLFTSILVFSWFYLNKKSFIWKDDGLEGHFNILVYFGKYLRQIIYDLFKTGKYSIPMFDFSIGLGSDVFSTLHSPTIGDPLTILSVLISTSKTEYLYTFLVLLRIYLSGITFSEYLKFIDQPRFARLCGSVSYAFCGFTLFAAARHPYFINPMIYLPLLLLGVEKIYKNQRPYLFIIMICVSAVSNFYFFYMLSILVFIYALIRFFSIYQEDRIKNIFKRIGQFSIFYIIGLLMASFMFLPVVMLTLSTKRAEIRPIVDIFYHKNYYLNFLSSFITNDSPGSWTYLGYPAVSLIAVILLFTKKKVNFHIKTGFIILTVFLLLPVMGHILNGFSYVSNRWVWGYSFIVGLITAKMMPDILKPENKQLAVISIFTFLYFCINLWISRSEVFFASFAILLVTIIVIYSFNTFTFNKIILVRYAQKVIILLLIIFSIVIQAGYRYSPKYGKYINEFYNNKNEVLNLLTDNHSNAVKDIGDMSFYRYDNHTSPFKRNLSMINHINGTTYFFSLLNPYIYNFLSEMNMNSIPDDRMINGLDNRTAMDILASVKYFVVNSGNERYLPYGYDKFVHKHNDLFVYENAYALPLGYTYDNTIPETEYRKFSAIQKQQALLQGAVINNNTNNSLNTVAPVFNHTVIPYQIKCGKDIVYENGAFIVNNASSVVTLSFEGLEDCETYLNFINLHHLEGRRARANITVKSGNISKTINYRTPYFSWYSDKHNYLVNLCYSAKEKTQIEIKFQYKGTYTFDSLEVICQPVSSLKQQTDKLKEVVLENVNIEANLITGTISSDKDKLLCFSIPYNKGWRAYIDGNEVEMLNVNTMYCGVFIPAGNHEIKLKYMTPYLKKGIVLSLIGLCIFIVVIVINYIRRKNMTSNGQKLITKEKLSKIAVIFLLVIGLMCITAFLARDTGVKYPSYKLGENIELSGKKSDYQTSGWSHPEEWGTWTEGESVVLAMGVNSKKDLLLHINIMWMFNNNPVDLYVNGKFIDSFVFAAGDNVIKIPKEYFPNKQLNILFGIKDPKSPKDLGQSDDTRKLGMGVISFYIE